MIYYRAKLADDNGFVFLESKNELSDKEVILGLINEGEITPNDQIIEIEEISVEDFEEGILCN